MGALVKPLNELSLGAHFHLPEFIFLTDVFFPDSTGGAGRVAYHLSRELAETGHPTYVLTRNTDGALPPISQMQKGLFVYRFPVPAEQALNFLLSEIKDSYSTARKLTQRISFDFVCAHQSLVAVGPVLMGPLRATPLLYFFHSPWHEEYLLKKKWEPGIFQKTLAFLMKRMERRILIRARKVFVLSDYMADKLQSLHNIPKNRIVKVPGGVDTNRFRLAEGGKEAARRKGGLIPGRTIFITIRNLVPRMGIENLIEAFQKSELLRQKAALFIGGEGPIRSRLESLAECAGLQDCIRFLGHIPEETLPFFYQAADFFVLPTRELEGFGLVILEAMASGTPVLGTPVGAIPEVIGPFDKRLLFAGTDWSHIKSKLEDLIRKPDRYRFDPEACRRYVEENFSWTKMAKAFEKEVRGLYGI